MAIELDAATFLLAVLSLLQLGLGVPLLKRRKSPLRLLSGMLLALNGAAAMALAVQRLMPDASGAAQWLRVFDAPTGSLLLILALVLSARSDAWNRRWGLAVSLWAVASLLLGVVIAGAPGFYARYVEFSWSILPLMVGYSGLLWVLHRQPDSNPLLWVAFAPRIAEFGTFYGAAALSGLQGYPEGAPLLRIADQALKIQLLVVLLIVAARLTRGATKDRRAAIRLLVLVAGAFVAFTQISLAAAGGGSTAQYVVSLLTLYVVRPPALGLALEPRATKLILGWGGLALGAYVGFKAALAAVLSHPFLQVSAFDAASLGLALAAVGAFAIGSGTFGLRTGPNDLTRRPTDAERLAIFLLGHAAGRWVDQEDMARGSGIATKNVKRTLDQLRRHVGDEEIVLVRLSGVRAKKVYRLQETKAEALRVWLSRLAVSIPLDPLK